MNEAIQAEALRGSRRPGQNAPLKRRLVAALMSNWQPMLGVVTLRKDSALHRLMGRANARMAKFMVPLGEKAEKNAHPAQYRGWEREAPQELLLRPSFDEVEELTELVLEVESGALPSGLLGHVFFQSFSNEAHNETRFMGRPILFRLDFDNTSGPSPTARLTSRKLRTPQHIFKQHAGASDDRFRLLQGSLWVSPTVGLQGDHANGIATVDDALIVTGNVAIPMQVNKRTLEVTGPFGRAADFFPAMPMNVPFPPYFVSAHPFYDEHTQEFFMVNYGFGFVRIVTWRVGEESFRSYLLTDAAGKPLNLKTSSHSLMVTRDFVVVFNNDGHLLDAPNPFAQDTFALIAPREQMVGAGGEVRGVKVEVPMTGNHTCCNYDNPDGKVTLFTSGTVAFAPDLSAILPGDYAKASGRYYADQYWGTGPASQADIGHMARYVIDARQGQLLDFKKVYDPKLTWDAQYASTKGGMGIRQTQASPGQWDKFYGTFFGFKKSSVINRMYETFKETKYTQYTWDELPETPVPAALVAVDTQKWEICDAFSFPADTVPGHACNIPAADGRTWFIASAQNRDSDRFFILDPDNLAAGPVCVLRSPKPLTMLQHPTWAENLDTNRVHYRVDLAEDLLIEGVEPSAAAILKDHVIPYFQKQEP